MNAPNASIASGLYKHQGEGIEFLRRHGRAILADDMGLGKTRQAIVALRGANPDGPLLVICPASLKLNWEREIRMVEPGAAVDVLGTKNHGLPDGIAPDWVVRELRPSRPERRSVGERSLAGRHRGRSALHQERLAAHDAGPAHHRHYRGHIEASRAAACLSADRHADPEPPA